MCAIYRTVIILERLSNATIMFLFFEYSTVHWTQLEVGWQHQYLDIKHEGVCVTCICMYWTKKDFVACV